MACRAGANTEKAADSAEQLTLRCSLRPAWVLDKGPGRVLHATTHNHTQCLNTTRKAGRAKAPAAVATRGATAASERPEQAETAPSTESAE